LVDVVIENFEFFKKQEMNLNNQIEELRFLNDYMKVKSNMEIDQIKSKEKTD